MIKDWFRTRWKKVLIHSLILSGFLVYAFFLADPLFDKFEILEGESRLSPVSLPSPTNNIRYYLERFLVSDYSIELEGWAFIEGESAEGSQTYVVLKSAKNTYVFDTMLQERPDITAYFGQLDLNLDNSGFIARILVGSVEKGTYRLGICIRKGDIAALCFTDRLIDL